MAMQQRASPPPPWVTEPPPLQSPQAVHPPPPPLPPQLPLAARLLPRPSPRAASYSLDPMTLGGVHGTDVHGKDHSFPIAALDVEAETSAKKVSSATKRKESGGKQQKEKPTKRFKLPAAPVSPMVPARSTGIRMMLSPRLSPRLPSPSTTSPATIDIDTSSSNDQAKSRFLKEMIMLLKEMKKKFNKYWNKSHIALCVPVVFDPRFKLKFIHFVFSKSFPVTGKEKIDKVEKLVRGLFSAYTSEQESPHAASTQQIPTVSSLNNDPWTE